MRAAPHTLCTADEFAPHRVIENDDTVFFDLGPVFHPREANVGRTYVVGSDHGKIALYADMPEISGVVRGRYVADLDLSARRSFDGVH